MLLACCLLLASDPLEAAVDAHLAPAVSDGSFAGVVLVARDGKPLVRKAYGLADEATKTPHTPDARFMIFSVSKQFTAALILRLQDQGKLSVDDPVAKHVADWPAEWATVTVHHLLTHSAGIDIDTLYFWLVKHHPEFWDTAAGTPPAYRSKPLLDGPGATFRYSNAGYTVLSLVAAKAGGKPFRELMAQEMFRPLGLARTGFDGDERVAARATGYHRGEKGLEVAGQKTNSIVGAGDVVSTVDDLLKWDQALAGDRLLSATARAAMFTPHVKGKAGGLGYGWRVRALPAGEPLHVWGGGGAGFTAAVVRRPDLRLYVAVLCNRDSDAPAPLGLRVMELAAAAGRAK